MKTQAAKQPLRSDFAVSEDLKTLKLEWGTILNFLWSLSFVGDEGPLEQMVGWYSTGSAR